MIDTKLETAVSGYIKYLDKQSPIVSTSHHYLRGLYDSYGKDQVNSELDRQFAKQEEDWQAEMEKATITATKG